MIVSWNWLKEYVLLDMPLAELERRLMMAGLNHEGTTDVDGDIAIELEVTSNRPDCLGHIGVAREIAVLWQRPLRLPAAEPQQGQTPVDKLACVQIDWAEACPRYTARVIRNVRIGPSPAWLVRRLRTVGVASVNNVVDVTNYVLLECSQPLHAFDLDHLQGPEIVVRRANAGEQLEAINHRTYELSTDMCVIADARRAVALAGVMGGAETEVTEATRNLLIESAEFDPLTVRNTARKLNLHSESSFRFERGIDPEGIDWASRRCCELILELAGGELASGVINVGQRIEPRPKVTLRFDQLKRILGIDVDASEVRRILQALGNRETAHNERQVEVVPPSWRRDLSREIDLVEEVARIHGYDAIPEDVRVPMAASTRRKKDIVWEKMRQVLVAAGYDEAMTLSAVGAELAESFSPWTDAPPLQLQTPVLRGADRLRRSLVPSLLAARRANEAIGNQQINLFETAKVYLGRKGSLPDEQWMLALTSSGDFLDVKGVLESLIRRQNRLRSLEVRSLDDPFFRPGYAAEVHLGGQRWGVLGEVADETRRRFDLRGPTTIAEVRLAVLEDIADLVPQYTPPPSFPAVTRDLNLVVDESVRWAELERTIRQSAGQLLEDVAYRETYRNPQLGAGKKSILLTITLRDPNATLRSEQADEAVRSVVEACRSQHGAELRG